MKINNKGFFFTLGIILLIIPLLFLIAFYTETSKTKTEDEIGKVRCDEIHYFVEDIKKDMTRAVAIFGRRAAIFAIDYVSVSGHLGNYTFQCNKLCGVDCGKFSYENNGSQAAIAELVLCGTINATNVTYMVNHTMREWIDRIKTKGMGMNMIANITTTNINIVQASPWEFATIIDARLKVSDKAGMCFYRETPIRVVSNTSIIGLEDPLYLIATEGHSMKYIFDCISPVNLTSSPPGNGTGNGNTTGNVILYSSIGSASDLSDFCDSAIPEDLDDLILVMDQGFGVTCNQQIIDCVNASSSKHFGGIINEGPNTLNCNITIPWTASTGSLNLSNGNCISIINNNVSQVTGGISSDKINTTCYYVSNITEYSGNYSVIYSNGPSFFDRLDGNYNLSDKYANQSRVYFNTTFIGIETFVDLYELSYQGVLPYSNATWVDYLYWKNIPGKNVVGACQSGSYTFKLDCQHIDRYGYTSNSC